MWLAERIKVSLSSDNAGSQMARPCFKWYSPLTMCVTGSTCTAPKTWLDRTCSASQWPHCQRRSVFTSRLERTWTTSNSTWLVTSVSSVTSSVRSAHGHWTDEFNSSSSSFIGQAAGDLGTFKCPVSCAKPYISASWYQKHLSKCPRPTRRSGSEVKWYR